MMQSPYGDDMATCDKIFSKLLGLDMYRTPFLFFLPDHKEQYRTFLGAFLTILTLMMTIFFGSYKSFVLFSLADYKIMEINSHYFYPASREMGLDQGFKISAAITAFDGSSEIIEDPEIGKLEFYIKHWGDTIYGPTFDFYRLPTKICEPERDFNDLEGTNKDADFYPVHKVSENDLNIYGPKMKCITETYNLQGNYNTELAANLMVVFEICDSTKRICKTREEIDEWLRFKYIITLTNERTFIQHKFGEEKI